MKVAIIGGGIAGISAAYSLKKNGIDSSIFESSNTLGGDVLPISIFDWQGQSHQIDIGVSDFNRPTFLSFVRFLNDLNLPTQNICRNTHFYTESFKSIIWLAENGTTTIHDKSLSSFDFKRQIEIFKKETPQVLVKSEYTEMTVGQYLSSKNYSEDFIQYYIKPRIASAFIFSGEILNFTNCSISRFWSMHSIIGDIYPDRSVVVGGMSRYVDRVKEWFVEEGVPIYLNANVVEVLANKRDCRLRFVVDRTIQDARFDAVVLAVKPNSLTKIFANPTKDQHSIYSALEWQMGEIVVHADWQTLPRSKQSWGAFNLMAREKTEWNFPSITFWANSLSKRSPKMPDVFVTLNPIIQPDIDSVFMRKTFIHPVASFMTLKALDNLNATQGQNNVWICGGFTCPPFLHENAFNSGAKVAQEICSRAGLIDFNGTKFRRQAS